MAGTKNDNERLGVRTGMDMGMDEILMAVLDLKFVCIVCSG